MNEYEKRLREWLATFCGRDASAQALADLDALLAEHLGEVEALKSAARKQENAAHDAKQYAKRVEEVRDKWHQRTLAAEAEVVDLKEATRIQEEGWEAERAAMRAGEEAMRAEIERLLEERDGIRNAALEEAAVELARAKASAARERWTGGLGRGERLLVEEQRAIRALKRQPAERYLRESEVQRVLPYLRTVCGLSESEVAEVLRRLGVDIDMKPATEGDIYERGGFVPAKEER